MNHVKRSDIECEEASSLDIGISSVTTVGTFWTATLDGPLYTPDGHIGAGRVTMSRTGLTMREAMNSLADAVERQGWAVL